MHWLGILLTTALLLASPVYGNAQQSEGKRPATAVKNYTQKEKQEYQKKVATTLDALTERINNLGMEATAPQVKRGRAKALLGLRKQLSYARLQLNNLEKASEQDWGRLKDEMDKTVDDLTKAVHQTELRLEQP